VPSRGKTSPQLVRSKGESGHKRTYTVSPLYKEVKYAEREVEGEGKEQKVEEKGDRKTGKR
jgi:hypothetical protein